MNAPATRSSPILLEESSASAQAFAELTRRAAMLDAIGYAAAMLVGIGDWRAGVQELLGRLGIATGVSRVTLFEVHRDAQGRRVQSCRFDWAEPGLAPISDDPRYCNMPLSDDGSETLDEWSQRRMRGEVIQATRSEVTGYTLQVFEEHGTRSFVSVPVMIRGEEWWGFIGFDDCHVERVWAPLEIEVLKTAASLIGGAVERERTAARLKLSEERYALAARGTNDGLWDWDMATGEVYYSPRLHEILGREDGTLEGGIQAFYDCLHPEDRDALQRNFQRRFAKQRRKFQQECQALLPNGQVRWVVMRALIVYNEGSPARIVGAVRDITDRKMAELRLQRSEARLRTILDTAGDAIISIDEHGRIAEFNRAAEQIFGYAREAMIGKQMAPLIIPEHLRNPHTAGMRRYLSTGHSTVMGRHVELEGLRADGSLVPIELSLSETRTPGEHLFTGFLRDITERRLFQEQLKEAERRRANLARYFSPKVVERLMQQEALTAITLPRVTVLFADIIGFTAISRFAPGEETIQLLREFHALIEQAVFEHEGSLDKYMGDGLMATFGMPEPGPRDASNAVACARAMAKAVVDWSRRRSLEGLPVVQVGIGLHHGEVTLGDIGSERHPEFTVVGDTVNLASRIEDLTREVGIGILASAEVLAAVRAEGGEALLEGFRDLGNRPVRGRSELVRIWARTADDLGQSTSIRSALLG